MPSRATAEITALPRGSEQIHRYSRFIGQPLYIDKGKKFWGTWEPVVIPFSPKDTYVTITSATESRLDLLAYGAYQTPELWWVLAEVNNIMFPFEELTVGTVIRIPSVVTITSLGLLR